MRFGIDNSDHPRRARVAATSEYGAVLIMDVVFAAEVPAVHFEVPQEDHKFFRIQTRFFWCNLNPVVARVCDPVRDLDGQ